MIGSLVRRRHLTLPVLLAVSLLVLIVPTPIRPAAAQAQPGFAVQVVDFSFEPATLTVPLGATVTWTNAGNRRHTVTADDGSFDSGRLDPGEQFSQTFDQPGTFTYHCGFHPEMTGAIVVTEGQAPADIEVATPAPQAPSTEPTAAAEAGAAGPVQNLTPVAESRLAHIHAGTCGELGIVVYSFPDLRTYRLDNTAAGGAVMELITGTTQAPLSKLFGEPFSVHVHASAQKKQTYIACADIGSQPPAPWSEKDGLILAAREQQDSGYSGFTTLRPTPDGGTTVTIVLVASPKASEAVETAEAPPSTTYTSPTFGYTIGYGPAWQETENVSSDGRDRFVLFNGTSYITFTGDAAFGGDPQACVDTFVAQLTADPNVSNLELADQGSTEATGAFAIYNHDYRFPDRVEPYTLFVGCIPLIPNEAVLAVVQNVPTAQYDEQVALREALLRGLTLKQ
jgi:plastocyanin